MRREGQRVHRQSVQEPINILLCENKLVVVVSVINNEHSLHLIIEFSLGGVHGESFVIKSIRLGNHRAAILFWDVAAERSGVPLYKKPLLLPVQHFIRHANHQPFVGPGEQIEPPLYVHLESTIVEKDLQI